MWTCDLMDFISLLIIDKVNQIESLRKITNYNNILSEKFCVSLLENSHQGKNKKIVRKKCMGTEKDARDKLNKKNMISINDFIH